MNAKKIAENQLIKTPITYTDPAAMIMPYVNASDLEIFPDGIGLFEVRFMILSISASNHIFNAPEAPAPIAIQIIAIQAKKGLIAKGDNIKPTKLVKITKDMTLGFIKVK